MNVVLMLIFSMSVFSQTCEYSYTVWNTRLRTSEGPIKVKKSYSSLSPQEKGPQGCTPCEVDQVEVKLQNGLTFKACKSFAKKFQTVLNEALNRGKKIETVLAYRPSISKGKEDHQGRRTEFSHHAFGAAIDINENHNGLYGNCLTWNPTCRLMKGGVYNPANPLSIRENDDFVTLFRAQGLEWGGKIQGVQKDFMHFSLDGY